MIASTGDPGRLICYRGNASGFFPDMRGKNRQHRGGLSMKRSIAALAAVFIALAALWNANPASSQNTGWVTLFDGQHLDNWDMIGDANWILLDGEVHAFKGNGFLVSKESYTDFEIRAEFWVDSKANSGVFIRCTDPAKVTATNAYEVNIYDERPDPSYGTGAIVNVAKVEPMPKAADKWNTYEIVAKGPKFTVTLNGQRTVDGAEDDKHPSGRIALQYAAGFVKFRKVRIRPL
jgi:3-keto-disaccharide hydrolase